MALPRSVRSLREPRTIPVAGARHHQHFAVDFERRWPIRDIISPREIRTGGPLPGIGVIDRGLAVGEDRWSAVRKLTSVRSGVEHGAVGTQYSRAYLGRGEVYSAASRRGIPELHEIQITTLQPRLRYVS